MLVDNQFFYISIPRCGSTSFLIHCFRNGINVNHYDKRYDFDQQLLFNTKLNTIKDDEELKWSLRHGHEPISTLESKFGKNYEIIAVKRNKYDRFISYWKHCIHSMIYHYDDIETAIKFSKMDENEIFDFNPEILYTSNIKSTEDVCKIFINKFGLENHIKKNPVKASYLQRAFFPVFVPTSYYHQHDNRVLWFDFNQLNLMEEWVSEKLNRNFKLVKSNSSEGIECNLKLTDNFIEKYDSIYGRFETMKNTKSIL